MTKLKPVSRQEMIGKLKGFGFDGPFSGGKHQYMIKGEIRLTLPNPHGQEIGIDLLSRILRQAGVSKKAWAGK